MSTGSLSHACAYTHRKRHRHPHTHTHTFRTNGRAGRLWLCSCLHVFLSLRLLVSMDSLSLSVYHKDAERRMGENCVFVSSASLPPVSLPSTHHHHHLSLWGLLLLLDGDLVLDRFVWRYYFVSSLLLSNAHPLTNMCIPYGEGVPRTVSVDG